MQKFKLESNKERIDKVLNEKLDYSRSTIAKMLEQGLILINGKKVKPSYLVNFGDTVEIVKEFVKETNITPTKMELTILYEDEDVMVINKPVGVVVHPGCGNKENTLANGLLYYTKHLSDVNGQNRPGIVHRIDKDTSGLMLVAKSNKAHEILSEDFKIHAIKREYVALLCGVFPHSEAKIDAPIGRDGTNRKRMTVTSKNSKNAITYLKVLKRFSNHTLVSLRLETGRTHQIRVHMKYIGYPVFNDPVYSVQKIKNVGQFLHSKTLLFVHPITKKEMYFEAEVPNYFKNYLEELK